MAELLESGSSALQRAVHRSDAAVEGVGDLGWRPAENVAKDYGGARSWWEVLDGDEEAERDRLLGDNAFCGVGPEFCRAGDEVVRERLQPRHLVE